MSKVTLYKYIRGERYTIANEEYDTVGADTFQLGDVKRAFDTITIESGVTELELGVDYTLEDEDFNYTQIEGVPVYTGVKVINATYQAVVLTISYDALGSYTDPATVAAGASFIGEIKHVSLQTGTPALEDIWVECDGQAISDAESPYNGSRIENLNGGDVIITLDWIADAGGSYASAAVTDITALNIYDWVSGGAIAAGSMVKDIDEATRIVTLTDTAISGSVESTFTNDGIYIGGGDGGSAGDQGQGHYHEPLAPQTRLWGTSGPGAVSAPTGGAINATQVSTGDPITDGTNGTPRTGTRTRPHTRFLKAVKRIK